MRAFLFALLAASAAQAAITVSPPSLTDRSYHTGSITFTVDNPEGFVTAAVLDGESVPAGAPWTVNRFGYHELRVTQAPEGGGAEETLRIRFIVKDPSRGTSNTYPDAGLDSWVPLPAVDAPADAIATAQFRILLPPKVVAGAPMPVRASLTGGDGYAVPLVATVQVSGMAGHPDVRPFRIYRGMGGATLRAGGEGEFAVQFRTGDRTVTKTVLVEADPVRTRIPEVIEGSLEIPAGSFVEVTGDVRVPAGASLTIGPGCCVYLAAGADFDVRGRVHLAGTEEQPVTFVPAGADPWGGFRVRDATAQFTASYVLFSGGGAEAGWISANNSSEYPLHSHRDEQPVLTFSAVSGALVEHCAILDCPTGQAFHGENAELTVRHTLVQRMITGGQINNSQLTWDGNVLVEMPVDDAVFNASIAAADYDGLYLAGGKSVLSRSVFGWCKDDGTDAGSGASSDVTVTRCWWESCFHEGMAWSEGGPRVVRDTVAINNGQGIECGFSGFGAGNLAVDARRILSTANLIGVRFGDNYNSSYPGLLSVTDSLVLFNEDDIFLREWNSWDYRSDRVTLTGTVTGTAQPEHPDLAVYDPSDTAHLAMLQPFLVAPQAGSGFAIAERNRLRPRVEYGGRVRVRLDRPAPAPRTLTWRLIGMPDPDTEAYRIAAQGSVAFAPGQSVAAIDLPESDGEAAALPWVVLLVDDGPGCVATGPRVMIWGDSGLPDPPLPPPGETLIAPGAVWRYFAAAEPPAPGTAWADPEFDDTAWPSGPARLGLGGDGEVTEVPGNPANGSGGAARPFNTVYFRHAFELTGPPSFAALRLRLLCDDGAAVYLNGSLLARSNLAPPGESGYGYDTAALQAVSGGGEDEWHEFVLSGSAGLRAGLNVVAVEVHQAGISSGTGQTTSSDLAFDLELQGNPPAPPVPPVWLTFSCAGEVIAVWRDPDAVLESAADAGTGRWTARPDLEAPVTLVPDGPRRFYRLRR